MYSNFFKHEQFDQKLYINDLLDVRKLSVHFFKNGKSYETSLKSKIIFWQLLRKVAVLMF